VARVIIANPLQVKAIAQAHVKTDKIDAGTLASLQAAGYLPQIRHAPLEHGIVDVDGSFLDRSIEPTKRLPGGRHVAS
jgi:hypothetical protein